MHKSLISTEEWDEATRYLDLQIIKLCKIFIDQNSEIPPPLFHLRKLSYETQRKNTKLWQAFYETATWEAWNLYFTSKENAQ